MIKSLYWSVLSVALFVPFVVFGGDGGTVPHSVIKFKSPLKDSIGGITELIDVILRAIIQIGTPIAAIFIIYSGFLFVIARGNDTKLTKAKNTLMWTLIGTAVLIGSAVIAGVIKATMDQIIG